MDDFLLLARQSFRKMHGLPCEGEAILPRTDAPGQRLAWCRRHRMTGLIQAGRPDPETDLQSAAYGQALHSARYFQEAGRLFGRLSPVLSFLALIKGPALAVQAWPDPGLRAFDDLDFLCAPDDFEPLLSGMRDAGYSPKPGEPRRLPHLWRFGWGLTFLHPEGFMVEVNHRFFPPHYPWPRGLDGRRKDLFMEQQREEASGLAPVPALHLLLCCLHAVWHGWARGAWLADIAGLLVRHPDAAARARELAGSCPFAQRALAAGCEVAKAVFGPFGMNESRPGVFRPVTDEALRLLNGTGPDPDGAELRGLHEQFMTPAEKTRHRIRRLCVPGDGDFRRLPLPASLGGLYWILRPFRAALFRSPGD
jgi:hypothetical protein